MSWLVAAAWAGEGSGGEGFGGLAGHGRVQPTPPPPVAPLGSAVDAHGLPLPALARVRVGDARWSAGTGARDVALSTDGRVLVVGGDGGVASFDAETGRLLARHAREDSAAVAVLPDGRAVWVAGMGSADVGVEGASVRLRCWRVERWALDVTARGEVVGACRDALWIAAPGAEPRTVPLPDLGPGGGPVLAVSPDGREAVVWPLLDPGGFRVPLDGGAPVPVPGLRGATFAPDGRLALWFADRVEVDGRRVALPDDAAPHAVAFAPDGEGLAIVAAGRLHVLRGGKRGCSAALDAGVASLAFGATIWVGTHEGTAPLRVDPTTCAVERPALPAPPTAVARIGDQVLLGGERFLTSWDARTGAARGAAALEGHTLAALVPLPGAVGVVDADAARIAATYELPSLRLRRAEPPEAGLPRFVAVHLDGRWMPPSAPVAAASPRGDVAAGLETLVVRVDGREERFDLRDQVHLGLTSPSSGIGGLGAFAGIGGGADERAVSPSWDPATVRPDGLWLGALAFGADGLLAMGVVFTVTDAWGEDHVKWWVGLLDPARRAIAGVPAPNNLEVEAVALSDAGEALAWLGEWGPRVLPLPRRAAPPAVPAPAPPPPPPRPAPPALEGDRHPHELRIDRDRVGGLGGLGEGVDLSVLLGGAGSIENDLLGGSAWTPPRAGDAERIPLDGLFTPARLQGRYRALALSGDGTLLAAGTDREVALWRVGTAEPTWRWDLGQGGTAALAFADGELWVLGRDGTALAIPVD
jgi:hypothetical protein